ncbi:MAG: phosphoribosylformylglycinamidine cyclo-ligase [Pyrinomonadaceae bacterium]
MNVKGYLSRIGVDPGDTRPDLDTLRLLQRQHLLNVPFENLDIHCGRPIVLDTGRFYTKIVDERRGGFCYELNGLFNELLRALGFTTRLVSARVFNGTDDHGPEYDHAAIIVTIGDDEYLTDVGFGDFTAEPLRFTLDVEQSDAAGTYVIRKFDDGYLQVAKRDGDNWKSEYIFKDIPRELFEFAEMCDFQQNSPESHFKKKRICSMLTPNGRKTVSDSAFILTNDGVRHETPIANEEEFASILKEAFGITSYIEDVRKYRKGANMTGSISYADAGVSIDNANLAVAKIREYARSTFNERTLTEIGSFGGMFSAAFPQMAEPILVASADGVGTKLKLAFETGIHNTVGADLVNHCVNDILVQGAHPLFFLDYFATGKLEPDVTASVVEGMARACRENGCVLLGGETAEMPDFYPPGEYDLAGFIVGVVDKKNVIDGKSIVPGDVVLGIPSTGLQTNGYSLARKLFFEVGGYTPDSYIDELGTSVGEALLATHASFLPQIGPLLDREKNADEGVNVAPLIKGLVHITGGGFLENIPRILPDGVAVEINRGTWPELPIFGMMQRLGNVDDKEMFRTFNMGVGMVVVCGSSDAGRLINSIENCLLIGSVTPGNGTVVIN